MMVVGDKARDRLARAEERARRRAAREAENKARAEERAARERITAKNRERELKGLRQLLARVERGLSTWQRPTAADHKRENKRLRARKRELEARLSQHLHYVPPTAPSLPPPIVQPAADPAAAVGEVGGGLVDLPGFLGFSADIARTPPPEVAPPAAWTAEHVAARLIAAYQTLYDLGERVGPRRYRSPMPEWLYEAGDRVGQAAPSIRIPMSADGTGAPAVRRMEQALRWASRFLADAPEIAWATQAWAIGKATGKPATRLCRRRGVSYATFKRHRVLGLDRIAAGLCAAGDPVE